MFKKLIASALLLFAASVATVPPAQAQQQEQNWASGVELAVGTTCAQGSYDFRAGSGTPSIDIEGCLPAISAGYVLQTDSGWTFAFGAEAAIGEFERCVRDGNAIVQCLSLSGVYSLDLQAGYRWDNGVGLYATVGYQQILLEYIQSCGVGLAYSSGHCRNAGGPDGYERAANDNFEGLTYGVGAELRMSRRYTLRGDISYQSEGARERPYDGPNGVGGALGDIRPDDTGVYTINFRVARAFGVR